MPLDPSTGPLLLTAGVPFLFKQWEGRSQREIKAKGHALDGVVHDGYPTP